MQTIRGTEQTIRRTEQTIEHAGWFGTWLGRHRGQTLHGPSVRSRTAMPEPTGWYLEATGRDAEGHLQLTVMPVRPRP